ncbi:hypothetical protein [Marinomonas aquiplantarum]|uniref:Uncharacterized protein n=1 Tax=Marinomonas aquiplantarum TaxID=491951 RepID=A0A366CV90_9GAMM|nr:hypothetical protein [Marinomonas aquiplantarum]RBO80206.1 hypothetical protein DFP76_10869 [Marinomonas aquiplantarum]
MKDETSHVKDIKVEEDNDVVILSICYVNLGATRYVLALLFVLFSGVALVNTFQIYQMLNFDALDFGLLLGVISTITLFFILLKMAHRLLRKVADLTIKITPNGLEYDSGIPPLFIGFGSGYFDFWKSVFFKRQHIEFDSSEMKAIYLEEKKSQRCLVMMKRGKEIEIAKYITDQQKKDLYQLLKKTTNDVRK